jgi:colanic acid biosynthesis protein WcaH
MKSLINELEKQIKNPEIGLPDDIFYLVGRLTPFVNVDLLIRDPVYGVLLTWRDDIYCGKGWHFPGGIIRFRENISDRINKVAILELNSEVLSSNVPLEINEVIVKEIKERSHFISLLYECTLLNSEIYKTINNNIKYFKNAPEDLLPAHYIYKKYFN